MGRARVIAARLATRNKSIAGRIRCVTTLVVGSAIAIVQPALANNVGENGAWQFETTADKANRAYLEDMRQKKQSGYYAAPVYNTYIDKQYNCSVSSLATGSQGTSTAIGNSPTSTGHSTNSIGNTDTTNLNPGIGQQTSAVTGTQGNTGEVSASASGEVETSVNGNTYQTLNTNQQNSGSQSAQVSASNACQFGMLN